MKVRLRLLCFPPYHLWGVTPPTRGLPPPKLGRPSSLPPPLCPQITQVLDHALQYLVLLLFPGMGTGRL